MDYSDLGEFDRFVIYTKVLELLGRYGIKLTDVWFSALDGHDDRRGLKGILFALADRTITFPDGSTPTITNPEHTELLKHLRTDLGMGEGDVARVESYAELFDKLCAAIEKAPKSFAKYR